VIEIVVGDYPCALVHVGRETVAQIASDTGFLSLIRCLVMFLKIDSGDEKGSTVGTNNEHHSNLG
jgi:hypothetical protein